MKGEQQRQIKLIYAEYVWHMLGHKKLSLTHENIKYVFILKVQGTRNIRASNY